MATGEKRADKRVPAVLRIRLKHKDLGTFVEKFAENVSHGGLFVSSKQPKPVGTDLRFEILLASGEPAIKGEGRVAWTKDYDPEEPQRAHGMGIKFTKLHGKSREVLRRCLDYKASHKPSDQSQEVHTGLFEVPEHARTDEDPDDAPKRAPAAGDGHGRTDADLDSLLAEAGVSEADLAAVLAKLRAELSGADLHEDDLDSLLIREAQTPVTVDDATCELARILGGDPVRRGLRPAPRHLGFDSTEGDEVTALLPPPGEAPPHSEIDELRAPLYGDEESSTIRTEAEREASAERPAVAEGGNVPAGVPTDEISDELAALLDAIEHDQAGDTNVDGNLPQFLGRGQVAEVVPGEDPGLFDIPETAVRAPDQAAAPVVTPPPLVADPKVPEGPEKRKSGFFKKLFGK